MYPQHFLELNPAVKLTYQQVFNIADAVSDNAVHAAQSG